MHKRPLAAEKGKPLYMPQGWTLEKKVAANSPESVEEIVDLRPCPTLVPLCILCEFDTPAVEHQNRHTHQDQTGEEWRLSSRRRPLVSRRPCFSSDSSSGDGGGSSSRHEGLSSGLHANSLERLGGGAKLPQPGEQTYLPAPLLPCWW